VTPGAGPLCPRGTAHQEERPDTRFDELEGKPGPARHSARAKAADEWATSPTGESSDSVRHPQSALPATPGESGTGHFLGSTGTPISEGPKAPDQHNGYGIVA